MLSEEVKQLRINNGWTQKELADELGCHLRTIQKWEGKEREPRAYYLGKIEKLKENK